MQTFEIVARCLPDDWVALPLTCKCWRRSDHGDTAEDVALAERQSAKLGAAHSCCVRQQDVEHRLHNSPGEALMT